MDKVLSLLGLAKKAGRLAPGEEAASAAARGHGARLMLLAEDAAEHTKRRMRSSAERGGCPLLTLPADKETLGRALGQGSCAALAVTDAGFAAAVMKKIDAARAAGASKQRAAARSEKKAEESNT